MFEEFGFESASVNEVVRRAGGSLATLYAQFGNKEGLFLAVVRDHHERFITSMTPASVDHLPLEEGLHAIGEHFVREVLKPENLAMFRVIAGEGRKLPVEMQSYMSVGADRVVAVIASFLALREVPVESYEVAGSHLLGLWLSRHHYRSLSDTTYVLTKAQIRAHVARAVEVFLHGILRSV